MPAVYNNFLNQAKKYYEPARAQGKTAAEKIFNEQEKVANDAYSKAVKDTKISYEDQHRENAIQKLINENEVAEDMANMGLSDSGLNRTQQTAVQLSYANNRSSINRQKQAQLDTLAQNLAAELSSIKQNRISTIADIDKEYDNAVASSAQDAYKTYQDAETDRIKENNRHIEKIANNPTNIISENGAPLSRDFNGSLKDNNVTVTYNTDKEGYRSTTTYYDIITGKKTTVAYSVNPYTNTNNAVGSSDTAKAWKKYNAFENGYQPKGVFYNGKDYGSVSDSGIRDMINGNMQRVHKTKDNSLWIWDGKNNKYLLYED